MVFVYCYLVAPQFVADQILRTLRIIHYPSIVGEHRFQNIYYLPVEKSVFQDVNIQMRLMDGSTVPFEAGILPVKMVLHFRRVVQIRVTSPLIHIIDHETSYEVLHSSGWRWWRRQRWRCRAYLFGPTLRSARLRFGQSIRRIISVD